MKRFGFSRVTGNPSVRNLRLAREGQLQYCYPRTCFSSVVTMGLVALRMRRWASFSRDKVHYVFPRRPPPASVPAGVQFVTDSVRAFAERLRKQAGKNIWMMGGGEIIGAFLDEEALDEFIITIVPTFIGEGIPLIAPRHREVPLRLLSLQRFPDGVVQLHYDVQRASCSIGM